MDTNKSKMKKKVQSNKTDKTGRMRQLEAPVHTTLPPHVTGRLRGRLRVSMERGIQWEYSIGPPAPKLCVRLKWWGEDSPGTIFRVPVHRGSTKSKVSGDCTTLAVYQIRSEWPQFKSYIRDMGSLSIHIGLGHMTDESMLIGRAALPTLSKLSPTNPLSIYSPIVNSKGLCLGKINICVSIHTVEKKKVVATSEDRVDSPELIVCPNTNHVTSRSTDTLVPVITASSEGPIQNSPSEKEADRSDVSIGPQQLEVISELIERGSRLRSEMVQSLAKGVTERQHCSPDMDEQGDATLEPVLLTRLPVDLPSPDRALHELVCLGVSSGEDSEDDIIAGLDDISVAESDYPLHDQHLLAKLLYDEDYTATSHKPLEADCRHDIDPSPPDLNVEENQDIPKDIPQPQASLDSKSHTQEQKLTSKVTIKDPLSSRTALSSYLGSGEKSLEGSIVRNLGLQKLTELGRVSRARVAVKSLSVETGLVHRVLTQRGNKLTSRETRSLFPLSGASTAASLTYFVEYQFPAALNGVSDTHSSSRLPVTHEVMRVASKRTVNNDVSFNHQSVFPVSFNSSVIQRWWNSTLIFRVYCKRLSERMPFLVGKAVAPLRACLSSPSLDLHTQLEVRSSSLTDAVKDHVTDKDPLIGHLQVLLQLVSSDRKGAKTPPLSSLPVVAVESSPPVGAVESEAPSSNTPATKLTEPKPLSQTITPSLSPLQLLLMIPEAIDLTLPSTERARDSAQDKLGVPNPYIVCKLFCAKPHPRTMIQWATPNPQFGFKQIHPLYLTPALLEQVCNNFTVFEVWHRTPGQSTDDELVGLVKVSLHQFYLAYCDQQALQLCSEAKLPVVAMDSYCPVVNPFSGNVNGHLAVLCALGTTEQVGLLQQQFACGSYSLLKPHIGSSFMYQPNCQAYIDTSVLSSNLQSPSVAHVFEVTVEGVRDLTAFNNTVWGETDCFVQYHFPTQLPPQDHLDSVTLLLQPYRTGTTLCVPNPSFIHSTHHTLTLVHTAPIQQELVRMCGQGRGDSGQGLSGGVTFELWRRFYYPNIRDQLIAKTVMPIVKLCAMVSMQKGPVIETFSLPLRLIDVQSKAEGGVLDVTICYKTVLGSDKLPPRSHQQEEVNPSQTEEKEQDKSVSCVSEENDDASSTALCDTQQQTSPPSTPDEPVPIPEDVFEARIVIHSALHLQTERPLSSSVYVTLHPHPNVAKVSTLAVSTEQSMIWDHHCVTYIPNMYLQPVCSGLELQVWSKSSVESSHEDSCVGCVSVDLSPLAFGLRQISGWYNVVDFGGQVKGQLKVTVCPTERISYPSQLLSHHLESPPVSFVGSLLERQPVQYPPHSLHMESGTRPPPTESRTASILYTQLRENIKELDSIHMSLQAKLGEIEKSPPFTQVHSLCQQHQCKDTHSTPTQDKPFTLPASIEHKTFVSTLAQTEGIFPPPSSSNSLPDSPDTTPPFSPPLSPRHSDVADTLVFTNLPPLNTPGDLSPLHEEYKEACHYSGSPQEDLSDSEGKSCSLTDVSEDTELSHHVQLGFDSNIEQFESDSEQKNKDAFGSDTPPLSSPITLTEPSAVNQMQTDMIPTTVSPECTLGDVTTSLTSTTDSRSQPLSEIQQPTTAKPSLPKPEQNYSQFSQLPNFFMPPAELEESMRRLRASALSRPMPRTKVGQENQATGSSGGTQTVNTLKEVQQYLNSRKIERLSSETKPNVSTSETQRIARIFSSSST